MYGRYNILHRFLFSDSLKTPPEVGVLSDKL